jgi:WD40 repeat protein
MLEFVDACQLYAAIIAVMQGDGQMLTASGDMTIRQWDNLSSTHISSMCGHGATVKCIACHPVCDDVLASGVSLHSCSAVFGHAVCITTSLQNAC